MRYHFGYSVGHLYGRPPCQPAVTPIGEHDETTHWDPMAPPAFHTLNPPAFVNRPVSPVSQRNSLLDISSRDLAQEVDLAQEADLAQEVGLEGESSSESDDSLDLDDDDEDEDEGEDEDEWQDEEVGEDLDFRDFEDTEELFVEEMYA